MSRYWLGWAFGALFGLAVGSCAARADDLHVLDARELSFESYKIADHRTADFQYADPDNRMGREYWVGGFALLFNVDLLTWGHDGLYFRNRVHTEGTNSQVRQVGWQYELGTSLRDKVEVYWLHHSQHEMDAKTETKFPLDNEYGARFILYRLDNTRR